MLRIALAALALAAIAAADVRQCACDPAKPETLRARECSLCNEADKQSGPGVIFFLRDINPRKPNRWLALPRPHAAVGHTLDKLPRALQTALWTEAIRKAREAWGEEGWGIAYNGELHRTQCHTHLHIGKLLGGLAPGKFYDAAGPAAIRNPVAGAGVWVHAVNGKLRVHYGEGITETVLLR